MRIMNVQSSWCINAAILFNSCEENIALYFYIYFYYFHFAGDACPSANSQYPIPSEKLHLIHLHINSALPLTATSSFHTTTSKRDRDDERAESVPRARSSFRKIEPPAPTCDQICPLYFIAFHIMYNIIYLDCAMHTFNARPAQRNVDVYCVRQATNGLPTRTLHSLECCSYCATTEMK